MTIHEFAVLIRNKYPEEFNDVKDETLVNSYLEKYPQYKSLVTDSPVVTLTKKEFVSEIRKKYPNYNNISDDDLFNGIIEKYPAYKKIISDLNEPVITTGSTTGSTTGNTTNTTGNTTTNVVNITTDEVANGSKLVKRGMSGDIVKKIQELLIKHGFTNISKSGNVDSIFGSRTKQAVIDFQRKNDASDDGIVGNETWGKLIQEPKSAKIPLKLDPKTGLPDNSLGLPKFNPDLKRFEKYGISKAQQDADLEKLNIKEDMKLTDIINGMVHEQGNPPSNNYSTFPSIKDVLNPPKSNLGPVRDKPTASKDWYMPIFNWAKNVGGKHKLSPTGEFYWYYVLGDIMNFRNDGFFSYQQQNGKTDIGKWVAKTNGFIIKTDDGFTYDSNVGEWVIDSKTSQSGSTTNPQQQRSTTNPQQQPNSLTDVSKGGYLRFGMKGNVVRDMQVLINSLNVPEIKIDTNGVFNQQTLDALIKVQKMLGVKPKNGKYGIFGSITLAAINKNKTGLPIDAVGAMRDKLPKFNTDASRFSKYGVSKAQQDADLQKLGIQEDLIKKIVSKNLKSLVK